MHFLRLLLLLTFFLSSTLWANVAKVSLLKGEAFVQRDTQKIALNNGNTLNEKDIVSTAKEAQIQLIFQDKTVVTLGSESEFKIEEYLSDTANPKAKFKFNQGSFKTITGHIGKAAPESFTIETKTATIGIRGTWIKGKIEPDGDTIGCLRGTIFVRSLRGGRIVDVGEGFKTFVGIDKDPTDPAGIGQGDFDDRGDQAERRGRRGSGEGGSEGDLASNDYESWGYWDRRDYRGVADDVNDLPLVAEINNPNGLTPTSFIASLIASAQGFIYNGTVAGTVSEAGTSGTIRTDVGNSLELIVNFSSPSVVSGTMTFKSVSGNTDYTTYTTNNLSISGSLTAGNGFTASITQPTGPFYMSLNGSIQGNFYGPSAETTSGTFNVDNVATPNNTATGTFSATR
jgi:hypothetical protein